MQQLSMGAKVSLSKSWGWTYGSLFFSHGQLYSAMTRVPSADRVLILKAEGGDYTKYHLAGVAFVAGMPFI